ncbi:hypothetical protein [Aliiruegeria sabulilitoris]|uniref:hypothetical protein n=1 Tax=Aliiruegeria sabulilitoris TaxID=1510458 RepID=UPI0012E3CD6B|nr:hypothetical protein [Aliiruegeria sabulilitoris]NDR55839.1 hypothetical protein [Pseudoruegeria sp. M32A2M]
MKSITESAAFVASFGLTVTILASAAEAVPESCPAVALVSVNGEQVELPADTATQVTMLQQYGARYERVIDLILEENAKPEWTFAEFCTPHGVGLLAIAE